LNYRVDGIERRFTIGEFPTHKTIDARAEAAELRKQIDRGGDPTGARHKRREAATVQDLLDRYVQDHLPKKACFGSGCAKHGEKGGLARLLNPFENSVLMSLISRERFRIP
jgi:hypothetical protein